MKMNEMGNEAEKHITYSPYRRRTHFHILYIYTNMYKCLHL